MAPGSSLLPLAEIAGCSLNMENGGDVRHKKLLTVFEHYYGNVHGVSGLCELAPSPFGCV